MPARPLGSVYEWRKFVTSCGVVAVGCVLTSTVSYYKYCLALRTFPS